MSTDSVLAAYDPKGALRKALRESQERSASERAARAPRQAMPRDEAPATPLSEEEELFRDVVGDVLSRVSLPPSPAPRQGVAGAVSPAPAVSNANEDVGQRRDGRQGRSRHRCLTLSLLAIPWSRLKSCLSMRALPRSPTLVRAGSLCVCRRRSTTPVSVVRLSSAFR